MLKLVALLFCFGRVITASEECTFVKCFLRPRAPMSALTPDRPTSLIASDARYTSLTGNWCGYVVQTNLSNPAPHSVTKVSGSWRVPGVLPSSGDTGSAVWIGIDGSGSNTIQQIGTSHDVRSGVAHHYAWIEMYPQGANDLIGFPVEVGDSITAEVWYVSVYVGIPVGSSLFILKITNNTKGMYTIIPSIIAIDVKRLSAEWIVEAPNRGGIEPLTNFGTVFLSNCTVEMNGIVGAINNPAWQHDSINMVIPATAAPKATASALSSDGKSFSVQWIHN